ncbi:MAG: DUF1992 domain-containing protein [Anaerolineae bacterium]|nr:DUF1992 domain-containing protein [Anaerolineae bacterium]MDW8171259.1 DUF1992 domain-containing protein [Anaerolineae bacterium]
MAIPTTQSSSFETWLDHVLKEVIGDGNTAHLRGAGKPFDFSALDDPNTPPEWRLAYKVMRDNDAAPQWIVMAQELRQLREQIRRVLAHFARDYQARLREAHLRGSVALERDAEARWRAAQERARSLIQDYNRQVLTYNLIVPPPIGQSQPLRADEEIAAALRSAEQAGP